MDKQTLELIKLAIARLKDCKEELTSSEDVEDVSITDLIAEQFAEDGAGGEALSILEELLKGL